MGRRAVLRQRARSRFLRGRRGAGSEGRGATVDGEAERADLRDDVSWALEGFRGRNTLGGQLLLMIMGGDVISEFGNSLAPTT